MVIDLVTKVATPFGVGNFIMAWMVDGIALNSLSLVHPRMILYGDEDLIIANFILVLRNSP